VTLPLYSRLLRGKGSYVDDISLPAISSILSSFEASGKPDAVQLRVKR
jgi:hypothetical protein